MPSLFDPVTIGDIPLSSRIVMAPLTRNRSPEAVPNEMNVEYYRQRVTAGLIITEATAISQQGQGYANVPGLYTPEALAGWRDVTDAVHEAGGKIVVQLWHVGRISHTSLQPNGQKPVAPSAIRAEAKTYLLDGDGGRFADVSEPRALETAELPGIVADYARAAKAAVDAGFDGVEIHAANGYLIDQFLKTGANRRDDGYGGSIENRARLLFDVVDAVTEAIGAGRTGIRLSPVTPANGIEDDDPQPLFEHVGRKLAEYDLAYIHVIEGATGGDRDYSQGGAPFDFAAFEATYRAAGGKAAWMVNNGYDRAMAMEAVENGRADLVAFGKPFIANPDLVERLRRDAELNAVERETLYGGGAKGYIDYPFLDEAAPSVPV